MKSYKVIFNDNSGSWAIDAIATTVQGTWRNTVNNYDGQGHDIGFIDVDDEYAADLEEILKNDENVVSFNKS